MKTWFHEGLHVVIDSVHLLFDPSSWFDPHPDPPIAGKPDLVLISHGHSDHANLAEQYNDVFKIMHPATKDILCQYGYNKIRKEVGLRRMPGTGELEMEIMYKPIKFRNLMIEAFPAGHCVGSVQFKVISSEGTFLFTGDINTEGSVAMTPGKIVDDVDYLAIESTMGTPEMVAMPRDDAYPYIHDFIARNHEGGNPIVAIYGHSIGKAQEVTKLLNYVDATDGKPPSILVDERANYVNKIYEKHVFPLGKYAAFKKTLPGGRLALFCDLYKLGHSGSTAKKMFSLNDEPPSLVLSAFGDTGNGFDRIVLSSHDDWHGLNNYVNVAMKDKKSSGKIITFHGFHGEFSKHLVSRGYDAMDSHAEVITI